MCLLWPRHCTGSVEMNKPWSQAQTPGAEWGGDVEGGTYNMVGNVVVLQEVSGVTLSRFKFWPQYLVTI